jgi:D-alanyl-D-alanine carboxypeptidase
MVGCHRVYAAAAPARSASETSAKQNLEKSLTSLVRAGVPGAAILVRRSDRTTLVARGLADTARKRPMRPGDTFRIGSLTKTYVATVVLQLAQGGRLSLDDPVARFLPGLVPRGDKLTIRQLLNHTSGLFDFENDPRALKPHLAGNLAYHWAPAGSCRSHAHGYYVLNKPPATDITGLSPYPWAAGAIVANARDVASFYRTPLTGGLLQASSLRAMKTTVSEGSFPADIKRSRYGLGLERSPTPCGTAWGHSANFAGYEVYAVSSANGRWQVVLLINQDPHSLRKRANSMFTQLLLSAYCGR